MALRIAASRISLRSVHRPTRLSFRCMAAASTPPPTYKILEYLYVPEILEKRGPYRQAHLDAAKQKAKEGKIVLAGAVGNPVDSAMFIWKDTSEEEINAFVESDPYHINGLLMGWTVKPYIVVATAE